MYRKWKRKKRQASVPGYIIPQTAFPMVLSRREPDTNTYRIHGAGELGCPGASHRTGRYVCRLVISTTANHRANHG